MSIISVNSKIPRWFDPSVPGFKETSPKYWKGSRIRLQVECNASEDYGRRLEKARRDAERKYKGAIVYVIPKFKDKQQTSTTISTNDSDERKLREYTRAHPANLRGDGEIEKCVNYMLSRIERYRGGLRNGQEFIFQKAKGENFLSFKDVEISFKEKGIVVIQGINHDRGVKCSNGSGKTSLFQLLPVSLFGRTFKDQSYDSWANRWRTKTPAYATVCGRVGGKSVEIVRGRRPPLLRLRVNGKDQSSGMKSNEKTGTQSLIEQTTGFTWSTLANSVYIDRSVSHAFLSGTKAQRTAVLSRFQNLERFEKALALVKDDLKSNQEKATLVTERMEHTRGRIKASRNALHDMQTVQDKTIDSAQRAYRRAKDKKSDWTKRCKPLLEEYRSQSDVLATKVDNKTSELMHVEKQYAVTVSDLDTVRTKIEKWNKLKAKKQCPTCYQGVTSKWVKSETKDLEKKRSQLKSRLLQVDHHRTSVKGVVDNLNSRLNGLKDTIRGLENEGEAINSILVTIRNQYEDLKEQQLSSGIIHKMKRKIKKYKAYLKELVHKKKKLKRKRHIYEYALEAFSRDGIPAFLNRQLCPTLNGAADYYSDLFCDRDIQVKFKVEEGEFVPQIINAKGGESIDDQSTGERALAGLIASFALREVAPKTNVLLLDEPGEGLDEQYARKFARGLRKLANKSCTIMLASHNVHILSELSGERIITIEKRNKISRIIQ